MRKLTSCLILLALGFGACTRITQKLTPEEESTIRQDFEQAVTRRIIEHEGKRLQHFGIYELKQTANDRVRIGYEVVYHKNIEGNESAEVTFRNEVTLRRDQNGIWQAVDMNPDQLTLGFTEGMQIRAPASSPASPRK